MILSPAMPTMDEQIAALCGERCVMRVTLGSEVRLLTGRVIHVEYSARASTANPYHFLPDSCTVRIEFSDRDIARIERHLQSLPILHLLPRK